MKKTLLTLIYIVASMVGCYAQDLSTEVAELEYFKNRGSVMTSRGVTQELKRETHSALKTSATSYETENKNLQKYYKTANILGAAIEGLQISVDAAKTVVQIKEYLGKYDDLMTRYTALVKNAGWEVSDSILFNQLSHVTTNVYSEFETLAEQVAMVVTFYKAGNRFKLESFVYALGVIDNTINRIGQEIAIGYNTMNLYLSAREGFWKPVPRGPRPWNKKGNRAFERWLDSATRAKVTQ